MLMITTPTLTRPTPNSRALSYFSMLPLLPAAFRCFPPLNESWMEWARLWCRCTRRALSHQVQMVATPKRKAAINRSPSHISTGYFPMGSFYSYAPSLSFLYTIITLKTANFGVLSIRVSPSIHVPFRPETNELTY
jgi:hypothetical protein